MVSIPEPDDALCNPAVNQRPIQVGEYLRHGDQKTGAMGLHDPGEKLWF